MVIRIDRAGVRLLDPDDFGQFKVTALDRSVVATGVPAFGRAGDDEDHVFVEPDALRALAGARASDPVWAASFEQMVAFAATHGWISEDGAIRAHLECDPA